MISLLTSVRAVVLPPYVGEGTFVVPGFTGSDTTITYPVVDAVGYYCYKQSHCYATFATCIRRSSDTTIICLEIESMGHVSLSANGGVQPYSFTGDDTTNLSTGIIRTQ